MKMIIRFLKSIIAVLKLRCPKCTGIMDCEMLDPTIDKLVYKCRDCGKEFI